MEIIYGTHNKHKVDAMKRILKENKINVKLETSRDIGFGEDVIEDGTTFEENSEIKARAIEKFCHENNITGKIIITDDAGLCIDKLNGGPGVHTARYAGENPTQLENLEKVLTNMKPYQEMKDRSCKFVCVLTAILENGEKIVARGECNGHIAKDYGTLGGLTYSPIFIPEGFDVPMSEMIEEKYESSHNHRDLALKKLVKEFEKRNIGVI